MQVTKFTFICCLALLPSVICSPPSAFARDGKLNVRNANGTYDFAQACYGEPVPDVPISKDNRTIPWGNPVMNGGECCSSLDEIRQGIDAVDQQLLALLATRAAYVREATRFKATHDTVDVPSRDQQVIEQAIADAPQYNLPQVIADGVFTAIINASVKFELCVFDSFDN